MRRRMMRPSPNELQGHITRQQIRRDVTSPLSVFDNGDDRLFWFYQNVSGARYTRRFTSKIPPSGIIGGVILDNGTLTAGGERNAQIDKIQTNIYAVFFGFQTQNNVKLGIYNADTRTLLGNKLTLESSGFSNTTDCIVLGGNMIACSTKTKLYIVSYDANYQLTKLHEDATHPITEMAYLGNDNGDEVIVAGGRNGTWVYRVNANGVTIGASIGGGMNKVFAENGKIVLATNGKIETFDYFPVKKTGTFTLPNRFIVTYALSIVGDFIAVIWLERKMILSLIHYDKLVRTDFNDLGSNVQLVSIAPIDDERFAFWWRDEGPGVSSRSTKELVLIT